jgi:SAM-dependent methyltransferase
MNSAFFQDSYKQLTDSPNGTRFWWHSMPLPDGSRTNGANEDKNHQFKFWDATRIPRLSGLSGKRVLDIGANDGFFSLAAHFSGAQEVISLDKDWETWPHNINYASSVWNIPLNIVTEDFLKYDTDMKFDIIFFFGVLYHLEDIFSAMRKLCDLLTNTGVIYLETQMSQLKSEFPIFEYASDKYPTVARQGKESLNAVGISSYLFPNNLAIENLCYSYDLNVDAIGEGSDYVLTNPTRQIFKIWKNDF